MKRLLLLLFILQGISGISKAQTLTIDERKFTDRWINVRQMLPNSRSCFEFYKNDVKLIENIDYTYIYHSPTAPRGGIYHVETAFGFWKPGDVIYVKDVCGNEISNYVTIKDDFVYIEVPAGISHIGNGIGSDETGSPYSKATKPVDVGKCELVEINSHVLFPVSLALAMDKEATSTTTGIFKIDGLPISQYSFDAYFGGFVGVNHTVNPNGSLTTDGFTVLTTQNSYTGDTPVTIEYTHNGFPDKTDFGISIGGVTFRSIKNGGVQIRRRNYLGDLIEDNFTGDFSNATFKIVFDTAEYKLYINDVLQATMARTVTYQATSGILSNTGSLPYKSGVTFDPTTSGEAIITSLTDGAVTAFQYFNVAEDMTINESTTNVTCNGESTGSVTVNVTGGQGAKTYSKDGVTYQSSNVIGGLAAGKYTIYVRDASGCVAQKNITINENPVLVPFTTPSNANCTGENNGSVSVSATGGSGFYEYKREGGSYSTTTNFGSLAAGTYTFFVKDAAGCEKSIQATVGTNSTLNASTTLTSIDCFGFSTGQISVSTTGNESGTIQYSLNDVDYQTTATFAALSANTYTVYVKDDYCKITLADQVISQSPEINLTNLISANAVSCNGLSDGNIVVNPDGGSPDYTFSSDGSNYTPTPARTHTFENLSAGNFKVWVRDSKGCIKESGIVSVTQPNALTVAVASKVDILCNGFSTGSVTLNANEGTSPYKYAITGIATTPNATIGNLEAGNYSFTAEDANGCTAQTTTEIIQPTAILATASVTATVSCFGGNNGQLTVTASGGTGTLEYSKDASFYQTQPVFNTLSSGNYTINVKDANNCIVNADQVNISEPTDIAFSIATQKNVLCFGGNTGEIALAATGGVGNYTYSKDGTTFSNSAIFTGFATSDQTFTVRDGNNCPKSLTTTITQPTDLITSLTKTQDVLCFAGNTGKITTAANGGTEPYQYALGSGAFVNQVVPNSHFIDTLRLGTYQVRVRDANGCTKTTNQVTVNQPTDIIASVAANVPVNCFGESNGSITIAATEGTPGYNFSLNGAAAQTSGTFSGLSQGNYTIKVRDANDCPKDITATVGQPAAAYTLALTSTTNLSCFENNTGVVEVANAGGNGGYQVSKDNTNFQTSTTFGGLASGGYTIYGKDSKGCAAQVSGITLTEPTDISITLLSKTDVNCDFYARGEALVRATGSNGGFNYTLSGSDFRFDPIVPVTNNSGEFKQLKSGSYTLTATDVRACAKNFTVAIDSKSSTVGFDISKSLPTSCLASDGNITVINPRGGRDPLTFSISTQNSFTTNPTFGNLKNGNYIITVADSLCEYKRDVDLKLPNSINAGYTISPISCTTSEANLSVSPITGGNGNYELSQDGGGFTSTTNFNNLAPKVYAFTVRDNPLSCETVLSVEIKEQNRSDLEFTNRTNILCFGNNTGQIAIQGNNNLAPFTYAINNGSFGSDGTFPNLTVGTYKLYSRNRIGCVDSLQATLTEPPLLVNTTTKSDNLCFSDNSGKLFVNAAGGVTPYEYSIDNTAYKSENSFEGLTAGNYTTYLKDAHGCITPQSVELVQPTDVVVNPQYTDTVRCWNESNGKVLVLTSGGTPGYQYSMDNAAYFASNTFVDLKANNYTFYVKDANQCVRQKELSVSEPPLLELSLVKKVDPLCFESKDGIIELASAGGNGGNAFEVTNFQKQGSPLFSILPQDNYVATVTDRKGCQAFVTDIQLTHPTDLRHDFATQMPLCFGQSNGRITINVGGGTLDYKMQVDGQSYNPSADGQTFVFDGLGSRSYNFSTIDKNGCIDPFTVNLPQPSALKNKITMTENKCNGDSTGTLQVFGEGATPPYRYALQNSYRISDTTFTAGNFYDRLLAKSYVVRTKDANDCLYDVNYEVTQPTKVQFSAFYADTVRCFGEANGKVKLLAKGGTPTYLYSLDNQNFQSSDTLKGLKAGNYAFYVKDQNNCPAEPLKSFAVTEPTLLTLAVNEQIDPLCFGETNGEITVAATGGNGSYQFIRDNRSSFIQSTERFTDLTQGEYTFKVLDRRACEANITSVKLTWPEGLGVKMSTKTPTCFGDTDGGIILEPTGGVGTYTAQLLGTNSLFDAENPTRLVRSSLSSGAYTVSLNDANGCQLTLPANVKAAEQLTPIDLGKPVDVCIGQQVTLDAKNPNRSINWFVDSQPLLGEQGTPLSSSQITVVEPGVYSVEVKNSSGCIVTGSYELRNNANALNADFLMTVQAFVADTVFALDISKPSPTEIIWTLPAEARNLDENANGLTYRIDTPGEYTIKMLARTDNCENIKVRTIKIFERDDIGSTDDDLFYNSYNIISSLNVFPNPNFGKFDVDVKLTKVSDIQLRITRATTGILIYEDNKTGAAAYKLNVDLNRFIQDTYIVTVTAGNSTLFKRILIMN